MNDIFFRVKRKLFMNNLICLQPYMRMYVPYTVVKYNFMVNINKKNDGLFINS